MSRRRKWTIGTVAVFAILWVIGTVSGPSEDGELRTAGKPTTTAEVSTTTTRPRSTTTRDTVDQTTTTTKPRATTTTAKPRATTTTTRSGNARVRSWADKRLDEIAGAHGNLQGLVNGLGELAADGRTSDAKELCRAARDTDLSAPPKPALDAYPGRADLLDRWNDLAGATEALMATCARGVGGSEFQARLDEFESADGIFGLTVVNVVDEADGRIDPNSSRTKRYDEVRETSRRQVVSDIHEAAG